MTPYRLVTSGFVSLGLWGLSAGRVAASSSSVPPSTTTVEQSESLLSAGKAYDAAIVALGFGLAAILLVLVFLAGDRRRSFRMLRAAVRGGMRATTRDQPALQSQASGLSSSDLPVGTIVGLPELRVGQRATYQVIGGTAEVEWSVSGEATLETKAGATVRLKAVGPGTVLLTAELGDGTITQPFVVTVPAGSDVPAADIPFLGVGYGSVIIALAVTSVTAALGLTKVVEGEAVATILGSLVTYAVARGVQQQASSDSVANGS